MNMTEKEWLGSENQLGIDIWKNKYCYENENFEHWLDRICDGDEGSYRACQSKEVFIRRKDSLKPRASK